MLLCICKVLLFLILELKGGQQNLIWYLQGEVRHHDYQFTREVKYVVLADATVCKARALTQTRLHYFKLRHGGSCIRIPIFSDHPSTVEVRRLVHVLVACLGSCFTTCLTAPIFVG